MGAHIFARSLAGRWRFPQHEAFNTMINFMKGSSQTLDWRERVKIYFSNYGEMTPLYLVCGVQH